MTTVGRLAIESAASLLEQREIVKAELNISEPEILRTRKQRLGLACELT